MAAFGADRKALEFAETATQLAPNDFIYAYPQVRALEGILALQGKRGVPDTAEYRRRLLKVWTKWDRQLPGSDYIREQLQAAGR